MIFEEIDGIKYIDGIAQVNADGEPITDERWYKDADGNYIFWSNGITLDHEPSGTEKGLGCLKVIRDKERAQEVNKKSIETARKNKTMRESAQMILNMKATKKAVMKVIKSLTEGDDLDISEDDLPAGLTQKDLIMFAMIATAAKGNDKAATFVRDTAGEKPTEKHEIDGTLAYTEADKKLVEKMHKRLANDLQPETGPEETP